MDEALKAATHPHDFKLLVAADGPALHLGRADLLGRPLRATARRRPGRRRRSDERAALAGRPAPAHSKLLTSIRKVTGIIARGGAWCAAAEESANPDLSVMGSNETCPVCHTAEIISGKWTLLVIRDLADGCSRFCELERSLDGISPRTLSLRLRALEAEGIVERRTYPEVPPRVEYRLTAKGEALVPLIEQMRSYGQEWLDERQRPRAARLPRRHVAA